MKHALALILAGGTLGIVADAQAGALPATPQATRMEGHADAADRPLLVEDDGEEGGWFWSNGGGSDADSSDDGNGGGSDSDDCNLTDPACAAGNAAPAGSVAPPKNGLFTDGTAPVVKSN